MKKVVLFGGSFDPIHYGHLKMIQSAIKQTKANEGWFILADQAPLKDNKQAPYETRLSFIQKMIKPFKKLKVTTIEKDMPKPNYTFDTIKQLQRLYPGITFVLLIGTDQAVQFKQWKDQKELLQLVEVVVYPRTLEPIDDVFTKLSGETFDVSSTQIRQGLSQETHPAILNEMIIHGVYGEEMLREFLHESRVQHSIEVAKLMVEFARHYNLDTQFYYGLGLIHDLMKQKEKDHELDSLLSEEDKKNPPYMWHAIACHHYLSRIYKIKNRTFTNAIYHHVSGQSASVAGMLLYIADKCERTRKYDTEGFIELTKKDLFKGFNAVKKEAMQYRDNKGANE